MSQISNYFNKHRKNCENCPVSSLTLFCHDFKIVNHFHKVFDSLLCFFGWSGPGSLELWSNASKVRSLLDLFFVLVTTSDWNGWCRAVSAAKRTSLATKSHISSKFYCQRLCAAVDMWPSHWIFSNSVFNALNCKHLTNQKTVANWKHSSR